MFSKTELGCLVNRILRGEITGITARNHPLLMVNLLLADAELFRDDTTIPYIVQWLQLLYGGKEVYLLQEKAPPPIVHEKLQRVAEEAVMEANPTTAAYVRAIIGENPSPTMGRTAVAIYHRIHRIFHHNVPELEAPPTGITPVCILGLKGSGKSYILEKLKAQGEEVHEVYAYLDVMRQRGDGEPDGLPEPPWWEDEPLMVGLRDRGWDRAPPKRFFVGSLVRLSEMRALCVIGSPILVHIEVSNALRHRRTRKRGRKIEAEALEDWLVELDAHRGGEWPGYETNDLGTLLSLTKYSIKNDGTSSIDTLVEKIIKHVDTTQ